MDAGLPSDEQWNALFDFIENDEEMCKGVYLHPGGKARLAKKWSSLAIIVNGIENATAKKDGPKWKSAWNGMKSRARASYRKHVQGILALGGQLPELNAIRFANVHHRRVIEMTGGVDAAMNGLQLPQLHVVDAPGNEVPEQAAPAQVIPNADVLLAQFMVHGADVVPQVVAIPQPPQANAAAAAVDTPPIVDAAPNVEPIFDGAAHLGEYELLPDGNLVEVPSKLNYDDEDPPKIRDEQAQSQAILIISSDEDDSEVKPHDVLLGVPELDLKVPEFSSDEDPPKPKLMQPRAKANVISSSSSSSSNEQNDQAAAGPSGLKAMNLGDLSVDCITLDDTPVNQKRIMNKAFHTPPGDSGLTPTCKRRLALAVPKPNENVSDLETLMKRNTEAMANVLRELRRFRV